MKDDTILVAYDPDGAKQGIVLARFNLAWLTTLQHGMTTEISPP